MRRTAALALCGALVLALAPAARSAPTDAQKCEADAENASGKYEQCRLKAEASFTKTGDAAKRSETLAKCATKLSEAFTRATGRYGAACPMTENAAAFDAYLTQCSDDTEAAAGGASLPDYPAEIASCNASLTACNGNLTTCNTNLTTCQSDLAACEAAPQGQMGKTAQTTCWDAAGTVIPCAGTGQDGEFQKGLALAYTDNGDGTVTDDNTGLMWEKLSDDGSIHDKDTTYGWTTAVTSKVATLNSAGGFAGYTDWRLPNVKELASIVNYANVSPSVSPAFNTGCVASCTVLTCSCTRSGQYWSSSSYVDNPVLAWVVFFGEGIVGANLKAYTSYVRAVRGGS